MPDMDTLARLFARHFGTTATTVEPIAGAGSNRHYYRLAHGATKAVGVVGTSTAENATFVYLSRHFAKTGQPVPAIYTVSEDGRCYLQEDLGTRSLYDALSAAREQGYQYSATDTALLERTLQALARLQTEGAEGIEETRLMSPQRMDARAAMFDLNYFKYLFFRVQDLPFDEVRLEESMWAFAKDLCDEPCATFLYRDFQARNVMVDTDGAPHFIDYQGGRLGALEYDVASFLWQASAHYGEDLREHLVGVYLQALSQYVAVSHEAFRERLQRFVLLRTLQVLGAYGLRGYIERKPYFLSSIPAAVANLRTLVAQGTAKPYPYLEDTLKRLCEAPLYDPSKP